MDALMLSATHYRSLSWTMKRSQRCWLTYPDAHISTARLVGLSLHEKKLSTNFSSIEVVLEELGV